MNKLKAMKLTSEILFNFYKSKYFKGEATMEQDLKKYIEETPKYKKLMEEMKQSKNNED